MTPSILTLPSHAPKAAWVHPVPTSPATDTVTTINTAPANGARLLCEGCPSGWTLITPPYKLCED